MGTWHSEEEPLSSTIVSLQEATVNRPVQVGYEGAGTALPHLLVTLGHSIHIHQSVIRSYRQEGTVWRKLELMDDFLPVLDVNNLCHVPAEEAPKTLLCQSKTEISNKRQQDTGTVQEVYFSFICICCS